MNKNVKTTRLTEAALMTGIMVIASIIGNILPIIDIIYPLPAIILAKRHDYKASIMSLVVAAIIIPMILGLHTGIYYIALYSPLAAVMAFLIAKDKQPSLVILSGTIAFILGLVAMVIVLQTVMGINIIDQLHEISLNSFDAQQNFMSKLGMLGENTDKVQDTYEQLIQVILTIIPAMIIAMSAAMATLNYLVVSKLSRKLNIKIIQPGEFSKLKFPDNFSLGILVIMILMWILSNLNFQNYDNLYINILYIGIMLFFIQGLAVMKYLLIKYNLNRGLRIFIIITIFLFPIFTYTTILMGLIEAIFDFRRLKRRRK